MLEDLITLSRGFLTSKNQSYQRYLLSQLSTSIRCMILLGQRGVGKTTTLIQALRNFVEGNCLDPRILYVPVDHFQLRGIS